MGEMAVNTPLDGHVETGGELCSHGALRGQALVTAAKLIISPNQGTRD